MFCNGGGWLIHEIVKLMFCISLFTVDQINSTTMNNKNRLMPHTDQK